MTAKLRMSGPHLQAALDGLYGGAFALDANGEPAADVSAAEAGKLRLAAARSMFGRQFRSSRELDAYLGPGYGGESGARTAAFNREMLPLSGVGPDCFWINDFLPHGSMRLIGSLGSWDRSRHDDNEKANVEEGYRPEALPYAGMMMWTWARWIEDGELVYGNLSVASNLVREEAMSLLMDRLSALHPTTQVEKPLPGGGCVVSFVPEHEAEARSAKFKVGYAVIDKMKSSEWDPAFTAIGPGVAIKDRPDFAGDMTRDVVFANPATLETVAPRSFLVDLKALPDRSAEIAAAHGRAVEGVRSWLDRDFPLP